MRAVDIIRKKRDGFSHTEEEIKWFINQFMCGEIPDYQVSAWAMAVLINGMDAKETTYLTHALADSGERLVHDRGQGVVVDKHSTGGVGDKTTLVVGPIVAAAGVKMGKMSGRGLGFSGGTLDKLESIPGFTVILSTDRFIEQLKNIGLVITGQSINLSPADGKLYALRDVTGTVQSIPLIASSVMSKKIAAGAHVIVLDVKVGHGAFMTNLDQARELSRLMVDIGKRSGRKTVALISDMNQPLGKAVGNSLEVSEAINTLKGRGPRDFTEHCLALSAHLLFLAGRSNSLVDAKRIANEHIQDGSALNKFISMVDAQGGDSSYIENINKFPTAPSIHQIHSQETGRISQLHARKIGALTVRLGAGRSKKTDAIDHRVGIILHKKVGDTVESGEPLLTIYANDDLAFEREKKNALDAYTFVKGNVDAPPLFYGRTID